MSADNKKSKKCPYIYDTRAAVKGGVRIEWTPIDGADKYAIKRSDEPYGEYELLAWRKKNAYRDQTAEKNKTYWYKVVALKILKKKENVKNWSPAVPGVDSDIPAPDSLTAECEGNGIKLQWHSSDEADAFMIYRRNDFFRQVVPLKKVSGNSYFDCDIVQGQIFYYSVQSLKETNQGNFSQEVYCCNLAPSEIVMFKSRVNKKVELKVRIVSGADGYIFERSEDGENFTEIAKTDSNVSLNYTDKAEKSFTVYYYRVTAYKIVNGEVVLSQPSEAVKIKTK